MGVVKWEPNGCVRRRVVGTGGSSHPLFSVADRVGGFDWLSEQIRLRTRSLRCPGDRTWRAQHQQPIGVAHCSDSDRTARCGLRDSSRRVAVAKACQPFEGGIDVHEERQEKDVVTAERTHWVNRYRRCAGAPPVLGSAVAYT